jgi:UDP-GlcNAc:undecaprenyl-phosphate GlcNAc-1-phosphate transferase
MIPPAAAAALACACSWLAAWTNRRVFGWLPDDPPAGRKQHARPIPLAGVVLVPVAGIWLVAEAAHWALAGLVLAAATGFLDDLRKETRTEPDWRWKALGLALAAAAGACAVCWPWPDLRTWLCVFALLFVLTNATNFLDNTDGVAASVSAASLLVLSGGQGWAAAAGFAAIGFLPWNWPRPRLFLGDAGAYALGLAVGIAAALGARADAANLWAVAVQLADFVQVITARLVLGVPPWVGDRRHLTHIAQNLGLPRELVAPAFAVPAVLFACLR